MERNRKIQLCFLISLIVVLFSGIMAGAFQNNFGTIDVKQIAIVDEFGGYKIVGKLYRPITATTATPAPAVLGLHGYNNDKDVQRPVAIELAKAGIVVLTIDQTGHGDSEGECTTYLQGSDAAYKWLKTLSFVNGDKMGIYGHSMGYIVGAQVAAMNPDHDAFVGETFPPLVINFTILHNFLHIWSQYEEWYAFPWYYITGALPTTPYTSEMTVSEVIQQGLAVAGQNAGIAPALAEVDKTYGLFANGTAYREHLLRGADHPAQTLDPGTTAEIVAWMLQALSGKTESEAWKIAAIPNQTYMYVEVFSGIALLFSFVSTVFLALIILELKFFSVVKQPMPERVVTKEKYMWWIFATINTALAGIFFIFFTHADQDWKFATNAPLLKMGMMNNWLGFYLTTAAAAAFLLTLWYFLFNKKERGSIVPYDLGIVYSQDKFMANLKNKEHWQIFGKTALLVGILFGWMYLLVSIYQDATLIEFRIFWAFAKKFTIPRLVQFLMYLPMFIPFFLLNGGVFLFGQIRQEDSSNPIKTYLIWWVKILFAMLAGLVVVVLIQYIGVTITNYPFEGFSFNPIMPIQLFSMIPLSALLYFMMIVFYRKTGRIYLGSLFAAIITVWFLSVGTVWGAGL